MPMATKEALAVAGQKGNTRQHGGKGRMGGGGCGGGLPSSVIMILNYKVPTCDPCREGAPRHLFPGPRAELS